MSDRLKFILRVVAFLAVTILIAFGLYRLFFYRPPQITEPGTTTDDQTGGSLTGSGAAGDRGSETEEDPDGTGTLPASPVANGGRTFTTLLTTSAITSPVVTQNNTIAYYDSADGRFYTITEEGDVSLLSQAQFKGAETITFDDTASAAVIEFPDGSNVVYDFSAAKQVSLPAHWEDFSFSQDGNSIVTKSVSSDPSNRALVITSTDGSSTRVVAALGSNDDKVDASFSPTGAVVAFSRTGEGQSAFGRQEIYLIGQDGEATGSLIVDGSNFQAIWSPDGAHILYSIADAADDYQVSLWYADSRGDRNGDPRKKLTVDTLVNKCVFADSATLYCAVPREVPAGSGSDPSLITAPDNLYKLSLTNQTSTLAAIPAADTQMFNLRIASDGSQLYYTDKAGRLNTLRLK